MQRSINCTNAIFETFFVVQISFRERAVSGNVLALLSHCYMALNHTF